MSDKPGSPNTISASETPLQPLARRLRQAGERELARLVEEHGLELELREVRQILLNPHATGRLLATLLSFRHLVGRQEIKSALCRDHRMPQATAMRFVSGLFWRDLMEIARDRRISPAVRQVAEKYLVQRLPRLSTGEKVALARRATPVVLVELRRDPSPRVIQAMLDSPLLTEEGVLILVSDRQIHPKMLQLVADTPRWGTRYEIRVGLSRNPRTPFGVLSALLEFLLREDLEAVAGNSEHSSIVCEWARQRLEQRHPRRTIDHPPPRHGDD